MHCIEPGMGFTKSGELREHGCNKLEYIIPLANRTISMEIKLLKKIIGPL